MHYRIAEFIAEVLLFEHRVREGEAKRDTAVVEILYNGFNEVFVALSVLEASAVPYCRRESTVDRSYLNAFAEILRTIMQHLSEYDVEFIVF